MKRYSPNAVRLAVLLLCSVTAGAQTPPSSQRITPNFQNVEINVVAEAVGAATGVTFIPDPRVRAQVSLINPRPMTPQQLYYAFLSILAVHNFSAQRTGDIVKIVPDANVRTMPGNDMPANLNMAPDDMVTTVLEAKNISAMQLQTVLRQFVPQYGQLLAVPGTNSLIITDRASNVDRIRRILARVDQSSNSSVDRIPLQNSVASEVVKMITSLIGAQPADATAGMMPRMVADDRTNSVMISGDPAQRLRITTWIESLDVAVENGGGTRVIKLKYADAEGLATKLKEQVGGIAAATGATGAAAAAAVDRSVVIWADPETNSLVMTAPPKAMVALVSIIEQLDVALTQIFIEAVVADVSDSQAADIGVNWAVFSNEDGTSVPAGGFISPVGTANNNPVSIVDLATAVTNPTSAVTIPLGATFGIGRLRDNGLNLAAMFRALRADGDTNVISFPNVMTMDNREAKMTAVQEVPVITGQYTNAGGGGGNGNVNPFTTVSRQEVGTILTVTPQMTGDSTMILKISLESSELAGTTGDAGSVITNKRTVDTWVRVDSGQTIVIGGLVRDSKVTGETRVPGLGRIPLLGELFRTRSGRRAKSNLMVFIRPKVLFDSIQLEAETNAKYSAVRDAQRTQSNHREILPLLPFDPPPLLPQLPAGAEAPLPQPAEAAATP